MLGGGADRENQLAVYGRKRRKSFQQHNINQERGNNPK
jgi:hypothetical protein